MSASSSERGRGPEAAVEDARAAIAASPSDPIPLARLASALVDAGRDEEAIATMEGAPLRSAFQAVARNWLGWYFLERRADAAKARPYLEEATHLRPRWGIAWHNLARALDGPTAEARAAAYGAYLEAMVCGDAHDAVQVFRRVCEIEEASDGALPRPIEGGLAEARTQRVNEGALAIARGLAARRDLAGRAWTFARALPMPEGEVPFASVGTSAGGLMRVHALVQSLAGRLSVTTLARPGSVVVLRAIAVTYDDPTPAVDAIAAWLLAGGDDDPGAIGVLNAAIAIGHTLHRAAVGPRGFRVTDYPDAPTSGSPAVLSIAPIGWTSQQAIIVSALPGAAVRVALLPQGPGEAPVTIDVATAARFAEVLPDIVTETRRAIGVRSAFRARPFGVAQAAAAIASHMTGGSRADVWKSSVNEGDFPLRMPAAWITCRERGADRTVGYLRESLDGVTLHVDDAAWTFHSADDVAPCLSAIDDALRSRLGRVTLDAIRVGDRFRVRLPWRSFEAGETVVVSHEDFIPRDGERYYTLASEARPGVTAQLFDSPGEPNASLEETDQYLAREGT